MFTSPATSTLFPPLIGNVYHIRERSRRRSSQRGASELPPCSLANDTVQSLSTDTKTCWAGFSGFHRYIKRMLAKKQSWSKLQGQSRWRSEKLVKFPVVSEFFSPRFTSTCSYPHTTSNSPTNLSSVIFSIRLVLNQRDTHMKPSFPDRALVQGLSLWPQPCLGLAWGTKTSPLRMTRLDLPCPLQLTPLLP